MNCAIRKNFRRQNWKEKSDWNFRIRKSLEPWPFLRKRGWPLYGICTVNAIVLMMSVRIIVGSSMICHFLLKSITKSHEERSLESNLNRPLTNYVARGVRVRVWVWKWKHCEELIPISDNEKYEFSTPLIPQAKEKQWRRNLHLFWWHTRPPWTLY